MEKFRELFEAKYGNGKNDKLLKQWMEDWDITKVKDLGDEDYRLYFDDENFFTDFISSNKNNIVSTDKKKLTVDIQLSDN